MKTIKSMKARKILTDLFCLTLLLFLWLLIKSLCQPYRRGFWCDDQSIRYEHKEASNATLFLLIWCFVLPVITIIVFETIRNRKQIIFVEKDEKQFDWKYLVWKLYKKLSVFYLGAISLVLITTVVKLSVGRLRPDFIDLCRPNIDCRRDEHRMVYIENYTCVNAPQKLALISEGRMSFISGHSAYSAYCAIYFCVYLHQKMKSKLLVSLRTVLQLMSLLAALFISLNRISINRHHWSDVFAGALVGIIVAIITTKFYVCNGTDRGSLDLVQTNTKYNATQTVEKKLNTTKNCDNLKNISKC